MVRSWCTPSVFPPPQDLPVYGSECAEDRLQGFQAVDALRVRARQDRASRITAVSAKKQRELARAIKRSRFLGLLPYVIR